MITLPRSHKVLPATRQTATALVEQITADAQVNADRITTAVLADAQRRAGAAQTETQRITQTRWRGHWLSHSGHRLRLSASRQTSWQGH
jgi:hypothetical protein